MMHTHSCRSKIQPFGNPNRWPLNSVGLSWEGLPYTWTFFLMNSDSINVFPHDLFRNFIFKQSLYSPWGSNLKPQDQKSHAPLLSQPKRATRDTEAPGQQWGIVVEFGRESIFSNVGVHAPGCCVVQVSCVFFSFQQLRTAVTRFSTLVPEPLRCATHRAEVLSASSPERVVSNIFRMHNSTERAHICL